MTVTDPDSDTTNDRMSHLVLRVMVQNATIESDGTKCMYFHVSSWKEGTKAKNLCSNHNAANKNL